MKCLEATTSSISYYRSANLPACCNRAFASASLARSNAVFDSVFLMSVLAPVTSDSPQTLPYPHVCEQLPRRHYITKLNARSCNHKFDHPIRKKDSTKQSTLRARWPSKMNHLPGFLQTSRQAFISMWQPRSWISKIQQI